jgi:hypothetical protein
VNKAPRESISKSSNWVYQLDLTATQQLESNGAFHVHWASIMVGFVVNGFLEPYFLIPIP